MSVKDFRAFKNGQPHIIGQPMTIHTAFCPVTATLTCNCGGDNTAVTITLSQQAACPSCGRMFNAAFNPTTNKMEFVIALPKPEEVPS